MAGRPRRPERLLRQAQDRLLRHTRTCSGYLFPLLPPGGRMDTRNKSIAVRFRICGQGAWLGFNRVSRGSAGSGPGSTPGGPAPKSSCPTPISSCPDLFRASPSTASPGAAVWIPGTSPGMTKEPALSLPKGGVRASRARGGSQTPRAPETPGGPPFSLTQWLNRTAMDLFRASPSGAMAAAKMDARNKSGHDEGGRSGIMEADRIPHRRYSQTGMSPLIVVRHRRRRCGRS